MSMDEASIKATIAGLIAKVETLQAENAELRATNAACAGTVTKYWVMLCWVSALELPPSCA